MWRLDEMKIQAEREQGVTLTFRAPLGPVKGFPNGITLEEVDEQLRVVYAAIVAKVAPELDELYKLSIAKIILERPKA